MYLKMYLDKVNSFTAVLQVYSADLLKNALHLKKKLNDQMSSTDEVIESLRVLQKNWFQR